MNMSRSEGDLSLKTLSDNANVCMHIYIRSKGGNITMLSYPTKPLLVRRAYHLLKRCTKGKFLGYRLTLLDMADSESTNKTTPGL
jgi:hypothetical protein